MLENWPVDIVMADCSGCCANSWVGKGIAVVIFALMAFFRHSDPAYVFQHAIILYVSDLSGHESMRDQEVQFLIGAAACQEKADTAGVFQDRGTDLKEFQADRTNISSG